MVCCALKRWIVPSSRLSAITPTQRPSSVMIRSMAKYSTKNSAECFSAWPYMVCSMAWPVRARRKNLGDAGGLQSGLGAADHRAKARAAGADHHHVVAVVLDRVGPSVG